MNVKMIACSCLSYFWCTNFVFCLQNCFTGMLLASLYQYTNYIVHLKVHTYINYANTKQLYTITMYTVLTLQHCNTMKLCISFENSTLTLKYYAKCKSIL